MNAQPAIIQVPLSQLRLSPRNARKTGGHDIEGLAASIAAHNLLQNLTVTPGTNDNAYEVVAGGRRLAAMQLLRDRGQLDAEFSVPCKLINDDDVALEASTAENTLREPMHPADQFTAFKGMVDAGKTATEVAAHFGVTETVVKQRLKLANVDPQLVQIYREDGMQLDQLQALALTDDHDAQRKAWFGPKHDHERTWWNIRDTITKAEVRASNGVAKFVGLEAYEAAGGAVRRDMFSARDEAWLCDRELLGKLALEKLQEQRQKALAAGWSWAEVHTAMDYSQLSTYGRLDPLGEVDHVLPAEQEARMAEINTRLAAIEDIDADELDDQAYVDLHQEQEELQEERDEILSQAEERWPAEDMAKAGVLIYIDNGDVHIERGRLLPGQKLDKAGAVTGTTKPAGTTKDKPKKPVLSGDMLSRLNLHRAAVLRHAIATHERPGLAVELLATHLLNGLIGNTYGLPLNLRAINVDAQTASGEAKQKQWSDVIDCAARRGLASEVAAIKRVMPKKASDVFGWVQRLDPIEVDRILATCTALMLDDVSGKGGDGLAQLLKIDMSQWWQPDAERYLAIVPKALVLEAVTEARGKEAAAKLANLKKDALIAEAAKLLAGSGWLPKPLRGPGYALKSAGKAKAAQGKKAAKTRAKKSTRKPAAKASQ